MKRALSLRLLIVTALAAAGFPSARAQDRLLPPDPTNDTPVRARVSLKVDTTDATAVTAVAHIEFKDYYLVESQSPPIHDSRGRILLDAKVGPAAVIMIYPPPPLPVVDLKYDLGALSKGEYSVVFRMNGQAFAETSFTIGGDPPPPPTDKVSLAFVEARRGADGSWLAEVGVTARPDVAARLNWLPLERDGSTFVAPLELADAEVSPGEELPPGDLVFQADADGFLTSGDAALRAPIELVRHTYDLGSPEPGAYRFVVTLGDAVVGSRVLRITEDDPPPPDVILAGLEIAAGNAGIWNATASLLLTNPAHTVLAWGDAVRDGNTFTADVKTGPSSTDPATDKQALIARDPRPGLHSHTWELGTLDSGEYRFVVQANGVTIGSRAFVVRPDQPPTTPGTRLAFVTIRQGNASTAAEVGILPARGMTVTDWGEVTREDEHSFRITLKVGPPADDSIDDSIRARVERHVYSLGQPEPGRYQLTIALESPPTVLGVRKFSVKPVPTDPPVPPPIVTDIRITAREMAIPEWIADVGLLFPRPGYSVIDWGTVVADGNTLTANVTTGRVPVVSDPPVPVDPIPIDPATNTAAETRSVVGGWPVRLVRNTYTLGALDPGEYVFVLTIDGSVAAKKAFRVPRSGPAGPSAEFDAANVTEPGTTPHPFRIVFRAPAGWSESPSLAAVTVDGPNDYSAQARLVSVAPSADPIGSLEACTYEVDPPGGSWDAADNGQYVVSIDLSAVVDSNGETLASARLGRFGVRILPIPEPATRVDVVASMVDGIWQAEVSFPNTGGWGAVEWGDVHLRGPVFSARARLSTLPTDGPVPDEFRHTWSLGALAPGYYLFVFSSNERHLGVAEISVPGIEPPSPLLAWLHNTGRHNRSGLPAGDDSDGDRWPCFAEFFTGTDPHRSDGPPVEGTVVTRNGRSHAALTFRRVTGGDPSIRCRVQLSRDTRSWEDAGDAVDWESAAPDADGTERVTVVQKAPAGTSPHRFMRLVVDCTDSGE